MEMDNIVGITELLASANATSSFEGKRYFFTGDLSQMATAKRVAWNLGISLSIEGGIPFAKSEEDFNRVTQHMIANRIDGWWHYVSDEEYRKMKGDTSLK